jgi:hypothetical protein
MKTAKCVLTCIIYCILLLFKDLCFQQNRWIGNAIANDSNRGKSTKTFTMRTKENYGPDTRVSTSGFFHKVTAVSYLNSGVSDTAVPCAGESDFLIKNSASNYSRRYTKKSWLHSGVNDTAVYVTAVSMTRLCISQRCHWHGCATNFVDYLREFEAIFEKALTCVSGTQGNWLMKKTEVENLVSGSL